MTIEKQAINGVKWTSISTISRALIQLIQLAIIARYLSAEALGLYALVQICLMFSQIFMDMGIGNAIIHKSQVKPRHLSELFFINLLFSLALASIVYFGAFFIALFFEQELLKGYLQTISIVFVIYALSRVHLATLQKKLAFSSIAVVELISAILGFIVVVVLLFNGLSIESLLYGLIFTASVQTILFWLVSDFRPSLCYPKSWMELKGYLNFGFFQTGDATVNFFNSQFDLIIVGKLLGADALGGYSLARQFCFRPAMIINPILTRVAFPVMAKLQNSEKLPRIYCKLLASLALFNFPLYMALFILAKPIVLAIFGEQWLYIVPTFKFIALWCMVRSIMNPVGSLLMAVGKVKLAFKWNSSLLCIMPLCIYFGANYGVLGVAISLFLLQLALLPGHWFFLLNNSVGVIAVDFIKSFTHPLMISIISGILVWVSMLMMAKLVFWVQLVIGVLFGAIVYLFISYKTSNLFRSLLSRKFSLE